MGNMLFYKCNDCGYTRQLHLGIGMMYPRVSDAIKRSIADGEYGSELKSAFESCELPAVCPEGLVYACPSCGYWDVYRNASVFAPTDIDAVKKERFGIKTVEEWGGIPYVMGHEIERGKYRLVRRYAPSCPSCSEGMVPAPGSSEEELDASALKCPKCKSTNATITESGFWD